MSPIKILGDNETPSIEDSSVMCKQAVEAESEIKHFPSEFLQQLHAPSMMQPQQQTTTVDEFEVMSTMKMTFQSKHSPDKLYINTQLSQDSATHQLPKTRSKENVFKRFPQNLN